MSKNAFTLAEVLITLGVIGVVAALTLPTVINSTQDKILETEYKKSETIIANGYKLMLAHDESTATSDLPLWKCDDKNCMAKEHKKVFNILKDSASNNTADNDEAIIDYFIEETNRYITVNWKSLDYAFVTNDGMIYGLTNLDHTNNEYFNIAVDVNGTKRPNIVGKDYYVFRYGKGGKITDITDEIKNLPDDDDDDENTDTDTGTGSDDNDNEDNDNGNNGNNGNHNGPDNNNGNHNGQNNGNNGNHNGQDNNNGNHYGQDNNNGNHYGQDKNENNGNGNK